MSQMSFPQLIEMPTPVGADSRADRMTRTAFDALAGLPIPDHLIDLVNELEAAMAAGGLRVATHAA